MRRALSPFSFCRILGGRGAAWLRMQNATMTHNLKVTTSNNVLQLLTCCSAAHQLKEKTRKGAESLHNVTESPALLAYIQKEPYCTCHFPSHKNPTTTTTMSQFQHIASVVVAYWFISISMVYVNKVLMSSKTYSIAAPMFVTWFQCVVTVGICYLAGEIGERTRKSHIYQQIMRPSLQDTMVDGGGGGGEIDNNEDDGGAAKGGGNSPNPSFFAQFPKAEFKQPVAKKVFPLSLMFVGMITFNNLCLKHVHVSFYTVARSLTIVFNVVLSTVILGVPTSTKTILCLAVVVLGFLIGSKGEMDFSMMGTIFGIGSSVFVSLNSIYTKKTLPAVDDDHWKLTFYNNANACILFLPIILVFESGTIYAALGQQLSSSIFWVSMLVAGIFGFSIGIITVLQIKATSPLTHNISGTAKAAVQSMMAFAIWRNQATFLSILGIFTVLGGSLAYTFVKLSETGRRKRPFLPVAPSTTTSKRDEDDIELQSGSQLGKK